MATHLLKMPDENKYLCFNHSIIAVGQGIKLEIVDVQGIWGIKCEWCEKGVPDFGIEQRNWD